MKTSKKETPDGLFFQLFPIKASRGDKKKFDILQATLECLSTVGAQRTNFQTVAEHLGIRRSHIAYHYPSIELLIEAAIRYSLGSYQEAITQALKGTSSPEEYLKSYISAGLDWCEAEPKAAAVVLLFFYQCTWVEEAREMQIAFRRTGYECLMVILEPLVSDRRKAEKLSRAIRSLVLGQLVEYRTTHPNRALPQFKQETEEMALTLLSAVRATDSQSKRPPPGGAPSRSPRAKPPRAGG